MNERTVNQLANKHQNCQSSLAKSALSTQGTRDHFEVRLKRILLFLNTSITFCKNGSNRCCKSPKTCPAKSSPLRCHTGLTRRPALTGPICAVLDAVIQRATSEIDALEHCRQNAKTAQAQIEERTREAAELDDRLCHAMRENQ